MRVLITGRSGFIGYHLHNTIKYKRTDIQLIDFKKDFFENKKLMDSALKNSDIIVHLAGLNRHDDSEFLFNQNIQLSQKVLDSIKRVGFKGHLIFASSIQEYEENSYGNAKKISRNLFDEESKKSGFKFTGLIIPNVFGPFVKPNYNSFIATFCFNSIRNIQIEVIKDNKVPLIFIDSLINKIIDTFSDQAEPKLEISNEIIISVNNVKTLIKDYRQKYLIDGEIPYLNSKFKRDLFKTFISYLPFKDFFPKKYNLLSDHRGSFSELIRAGIPGQVSYSETKQNVTRGNHFHTRKIERFSVISGEALIQIRKINSDQIFEFKLSGKNPSYIDMPVWYTHNIHNIGNEPLITLFWINEFYDEDDSDTFYEKV